MSDPSKSQAESVVDGLSLKSHRFSREQIVRKLAEEFDRVSEWQPIATAPKDGT